MIWLGPLSIIIAWITYTLIFVKTDRAGHFTLSSVAASSRRNYWIFCAGLIVGGMLFFLFVRDWLMDALALPDIFLYLTGIATLILQPIIAIVPLGNRLQNRIHNIAAWLESALIPVLAYFIVRSPALSSFARLVCLILLGGMLYLVFEFKKNFLKPRFLYIQVLYWTSFHLLVLTATISALTN